MTKPDTVKVCRHCGFRGSENYCARCSEPYTTKRITLHRLLHEAFHLVTHLDKGFLYTIKSLVISPGHTQRKYLEGERSKHQKPISMFFVCATIAAICRYWAFLALLKYYDVGSMSEANFSHAYMVIFQIALVPFTTLITYLLFRETRYNYAEIGVLTLYTFSVLFVVAVFTVLLKFIWPSLDTAYLEFPIFVVFNTITFLNFFNNLPHWQVVVKSLVVVVIAFVTIQKFEDLIMDLISKTTSH
jgi:uncharacterized protein DUF3667